MTIASFSNASQIMVSLRTIEDEFLNQRRILIEVAVTDPAWFDHEVHNSRPGQARRTVRPGLVVNLLAAFQLSALKIRGLTLELHSLFAGPTNHEGALGPADQVGAFSGPLHALEHYLNV